MPSRERLDGERTMPLARSGICDNAESAIRPPSPEPDDGNAQYVVVLMEKLGGAEYRGQPFIDYVIAVVAAERRFAKGCNGDETGMGERARKGGNVVSPVGRVTVPRFPQHASVETNDGVYLADHLWLFVNRFHIFTGLQRDLHPLGAGRQRRQQKGSRDGGELHHQAVHPPSITMLLPVISADAGDARNTTAPMMSSRLPSSPIGMRLSASSRNSLFSK